MTSRELSKIAIDLISEEDCTRWLEGNLDGNYILMFLMDGQWFEVVSFDIAGMVCVNDKGAYHPITKITAVKSANSEDPERWNPPTVHKTSIDHNLKLRGK